MNEQEVLRVLGEVGAVLTGGHFVYASGKHGSVYVDKNAIYPHTALMSRLCRVIAERFAGDIVDVVIASVTSGAFLSWVAHYLSEMRSREVLAIYAEKEVAPIWYMGRRSFIETGNFIIKPRYEKFILTRNALVVEDVLVTGRSTANIIIAAMVGGAYPAGMGALVNCRNFTASQMGVPKLVSLVNLPLDDMWNEAECPLCAEGVPVNTDVGRGYEFLARKQA